MTDLRQNDVLVIGGGPAGLTAAGMRPRESVRAARGLTYAGPARTVNVTRCPATGSPFGARNSTTSG